MIDQVNELYNNYFTKDKIKHAYFIKTNNNEKALEMVIRIALKISERSFSDIALENIKRGEDQDIVVIKTEKKEIDKDSITNLEKEFNLTSLSGKKRIYIIYEAHKMNRSSSNTILKFLEEPPENIIAFLVDQNSYMVLPTIFSRCLQINVNFKFEKRALSQETVNFLTLLETKNSGYIAYLDNEQKRFFDEKTNLIETFKEMIIFYNDELKTKTDSKTVEMTTKRIKSLLNLLEIAKYNVTSKTLLDKLNYLFFGDKNV